VDTGTEGGGGAEPSVAYESVEPHIHEYMKRHLPHLHHFHSHLAKTYEGFNPMTAAGGGAAGAGGAPPAPAPSPAPAPAPAPVPKPPQAQVARMENEQAAIQYAQLRTEMDALKEQLAAAHYEKTVARCEQQVTQLEGEGYPVKDRGKLVTRLSKLPDAERQAELDEYREMYAGARRPVTLPGGMLRLANPPRPERQSGVTIDTPGVAEVVGIVASQEGVDVSDVEAYEAVEEKVCKEWAGKYRRLISKEALASYNGD
jgi:hypothetical protein